MKRKTEQKTLYKLAKRMMFLPCNKNGTDKMFIYESHLAYAEYFRKLKK